MNRFVPAVLMLLLPLSMKGQLFPLTNQYLNNQMAINPAYAGCDDALSATLLYRTQWIGFKDAPESTILSVHTPLNYDKVGLGLLISKNNIGIFRETSITGNYAYRMDLPKGKLALGIGFGASVYNTQDGTNLMRPIRMIPGWPIPRNRLFCPILVSAPTIIHESSSLDCLCQCS